MSAKKMEDRMYSTETLASKGKRLPKAERQVVPISDHDMAILNACMDSRGFISACFRSTGVTDPTLRRWQTEKSGEKAKIDKVRTYSKKYFTENNLELPKAV